MSSELKIGAVLGVFVVAACAWFFYSRSSNDQDIPLLLVIGFTEGGNKDFGVREVARHLDSRNAHHSEPGIVYFIPDQRRQLALQLLADPPCPGEISGHIKN